MREMTEFQRQFTALLPQIELRLDEPMSEHTSLHIGGGAEVMAFPKNREELSDILKLSALLDSKPAILGAGTNVLAPDEGIPGLVVCLKDCLNGLERRGETDIRCAAGVTMSRAAVFAAVNGLSGLEFAHGIPGTVGGGVYMNAGAYGGEIGRVCQGVQVMDFSGREGYLRREKLDFSYRHSALQAGSWIVLAADFALEQGKEETIRERMRELLAKRTAAQPLNYPSAGSAFKRPKAGYAAALIDQAGLRGFQVGQAAIAQKHTGFAVNLGGATAADMRGLLDQVSRRVWEHSGIRLEPEVQIW